MTPLHSQQPGLPPDEHKRHVEAVLEQARRRAAQERPPLGVLVLCLAVVLLALAGLAWCFYGDAPVVFFTLTP